MAGSVKKIEWNKRVGITILLLQMASLGQCFCDYRLPFFPVYYPKAGEFFKLNVGGNNKGYLLQKDGKQLPLPTCNEKTDPNCTQRIYLLPNRTDLNFKKITLEDSGKYILEVLCPEKRVSSFEIIVQEFVVSDCKDMIVKEGENITCVCKTTDGYPSVEVTWTRSDPYQNNPRLKTSNGILRLQNISKNHGGTYACFSKSLNLPNTTSFNLKVVSENYIPADNSVRIAYFEAFQRVAVGHCKLMIICKARGIPEPSYIITHNGTAVEYGNVFTIDTKRNSSRGHYECLARNRHGSAKRSLFLDGRFLVGACKKPENDSCNSGMEWIVRIVIGASSFLAGILLYVLVCCCKKSRKKKDRNENGEGRNHDVLPKHVNDSLAPVEKSVERGSPSGVCKTSSKYECTDDYDGKYDDVCPRSPAEGRRLAGLFLEMRLRHTPESPGIEVDRDSAEYDIPESGNCNENESFYYNNYTEFVAFRQREDKRYQF